MTQEQYDTSDTIAAIATPPGEGGVAIIRISGPNAVAVADRVFNGKVSSYPTHTAHYGHFYETTGCQVDSGLVLPLLGKRSFTGEDTVELHCHGGSLVSRRILEAVLASGARAAEPGEFTYRAFVNGKIDLTQAEAVQELISAKNDLAVDAASSQLQGMLSQRIESFQDALTETAAILEAWVDFPEEGLEFASMEELCGRLSSAKQEMQQLLNTFHDGRIVHEGLSLCLVGSPNVGKSSLMNALLDKERAIVSHIPGTTRDVVEDHIRLNGLNVKLTDTAGIRDSQELIEQEGIRRSRQALAKADLILLVCDLTQPLNAVDQELFSIVPPEKTVVVWNKLDVAEGGAPEVPLSRQVQVSAKSRQGLDELKKLINGVVWQDGPPAREEILLTRLRHKEALSNAIHACQAVIDGLLSDISAEFIAADMRHCLLELGRIIGTDVTEDILTAIFSKFCVGK